MVPWHAYTLACFTRCRTFDDTYKCSIYLTLTNVMGYFVRSRVDRPSTVTVSEVHIDVGSCLQLHACCVQLQRQAERQKRSAPQQALHTLCTAQSRRQRCRVTRVLPHRLLLGELG